MLDSLEQCLARGVPVLLAGSLLFPSLSARETDNFCLPLDAEMADLGDYLEAVHTIALEEVVAGLNARIERALRIKGEAARARRLEGLHDPQTLAKGFRKKFGNPMIEDSELERALRGRWALRSYPGRKASHQDIGMHFSAYPALDPRRWSALTQSRTIKAYGVYFGTDKLVHLHRLGLAYYSTYHSLLNTGMSGEAAYDQVLQKYTEDGILSEEHYFGALITGVYSNADLAVNHIGFKLFMNLTDRIVLNGRSLEPLVIRCGVFWQLNRHVHLRSGWFAPFVSDHWNEALNPSRYQPSVRKGMRRALQSRAPEIVQFYTRQDGRPKDPAYYDHLARELSTYHGETYGHSGDFEQLMTIGNTCIPALRDAEK
jgi:hypothetical protein